MKIEKEKQKQIILWSIGGLFAIFGICFFHIGYFICAAIITALLYVVIQFAEDDYSRSKVNTNMKKLIPIIINYGLILWPLLEITKSPLWVGSISSILIFIFRYPVTEYFYPTEYHYKPIFIENVKSGADWFIWPSFWMILFCGILSFFAWFGPALMEIDEKESKQREKEKTEEQAAMENNQTTAIVKLLKSEICEGNTVYYIVTQHQNNSQITDTIQVTSGNGAIWIEDNSIISYSKYEGLYRNIKVIGKSEENY